MRMEYCVLLLALLALALTAVCPTILAAEMDEPGRILCLKMGVDGDDDDHDLISDVGDDDDEQSGSLIGDDHDDYDLISIRGDDDDDYDMISVPSSAPDRGAKLRMIVLVMGIGFRP